jgi:hypothetical protein
MKITNLLCEKGGGGGFFLCGLNPSPEFHVSEKVVPGMEGLHYNIARPLHATFEKSVLIPLV